MVAYLKQRNMTGKELYVEFEARVFGIQADSGKKPMFWNSVYDAGVAIPAGAVVHEYMGGVARVAEVAKAGHKPEGGVGIGRVLRVHAGLVGLDLRRGTHARQPHQGRGELFSCEPVCQSCLTHHFVVIVMLQPCGDLGLHAKNGLPANLVCCCCVQEGNVLGGAAATWGETMDDSCIDTIVCPDTAAVAERL